MVGEIADLWANSGSIVRSSNRWIDEKTRMLPAAARYLTYVSSIRGRNSGIVAMEAYYLEKRYPAALCKVSTLRC